jgi:heme exporter protein CcmD
MGGYARFVWPSYLLTFAIVLLNVYWARRIHRRARDEARRRLASGERP